MSRQYDDGVELSNEPHMISWDQDPDVPRAKMPCGHVIGAESLFVYCRKLLSDGCTEFTCPRCSVVWTFKVVCRYAVLSGNEKREFEKKLNKNHIKKDLEIKRCPKCEIYCFRQDQNEKRIRCTNCEVNETFYEFCWECLTEWPLKENNHCCKLSEEEKCILIYAEETKPMYGLKGCPAIRKCPVCGILIEHIEGCKQMTCTNCYTKFCFRCLKQAVNGSYVCGSFNDPCNVAPVQTRNIASNERRRNDAPVQTTSIDVQPFDRQQSPKGWCEIM